MIKRLGFGQRGIGNQQAERLYLGSYLVWEQTPSVNFNWWRISNIVNREQTAPEYGQSAAEIRFITEQGILSNNQNNAFSNGSFVDENSTTDTYKAAKAFDGNLSTITASPQQEIDAPLFWKIGYKFDLPVTVNSVSIMARQDTSYGQEWQTADIDVSTDGVNWVKYGEIKPMIGSGDKSLITTPVIKT